MQDSIVVSIYPSRMYQVTFTHPKSIHFQDQKDEENRIYLSTFSDLIEWYTAALSNSSISCTFAKKIFEFIEMDALMYGPVPKDVFDGWRRTFIEQTLEILFSTKRSNNKDSVSQEACSDIKDYFSMMRSQYEN
jgi:hypothetical protein